jgi:hypothetical protein
VKIAKTRWVGSSLGVLVLYPDLMDGHGLIGLMACLGYIFDNSNMAKDVNDCEWWWFYPLTEALEKT